MERRMEEPWRKRTRQHGILMLLYAALGALVLLWVMIEASTTMGFVPFVFAMLLHIGFYTTFAVYNLLRAWRHS
jgi:cobalamin biosynthesis protein CobD/CbiB